jgi:hypothetical protein
VRKRVEKKLNSRITPTRISSLILTNRKSRKLATRPVARKVVTTDSKVKNVKTAIFIAPVHVFSD